MSTRGAYGFKFNNQEKIIYAFSDAYPTGLGQEVVNFFQKEVKDVIRLKNKVQNLQAIPEEFTKDSPLAQTDDLWREPSQVLRGIYRGIITNYFDASNFIEEIIFCEYFYLINLDTAEIECYELGREMLMAKFSLTNIPNNWLKLITQGQKRNRLSKQKYFDKLLQLAVKNK